MNSFGYAWPISHQNSDIFTHHICFAKMLKLAIFSTIFIFCLIRKSKTLEVCGTLECLVVTEKEAQLLKQPMIMDGTGVQMNWTDTLDGWDLNMKLLYISKLRRIEYQRSKVPRLTQFGYRKSKIPQDILQVIIEEKLDHSHHYCNKNTSQSINCRKMDSNGQFIEKKNVFTYDFGSNFRVSQKVENYVRKQLEIWTNSKLATNVLTYGIRRYTRGAKLFSHVDTLPLHLISVILQVDQKVDQDWPLTLLDHNNEYQEVILKPGEMLFYEGSVAPHGRPYPLNGDYYDNMFVHFTLENSKLLNKLEQEVNEYIVHKAKLEIKDEL